MALNKYNTLATLMQPAVPSLQWKDIVSYGFISEFELIKHAHSQADITNEPWTVPTNCEIASKYFKIIWAHEELIQLNMEIHRLHTSICNESIQLNTVLNKLHITDSLLASEVEYYHDFWWQINSVQLAWIQATYSLAGFNGIAEAGQCRDREWAGIAQASLSIFNDTDALDASNAVSFLVDLDNKLINASGVNALNEDLIQLENFLRDLGDDRAVAGSV